MPLWPAVREAGDGPMRRGSAIVDRSLRGVVMLLTLGLVLGPFALPSAGAAPCSVMAPEEWVSINVPAFSEGDPTITDYAVSPTNPRLLHVTNGKAVQSSTDGGCTFRETFSIGSANLSYSTHRADIRDLVLGSDDAQTVYLAIEAWEKTPTVPGVLERDLAAQPHVVATDDGGSSWREADGGLQDVFGAPLALAASPGTNTVYLLVDESEFRERVDVPPVQVDVRAFGPQRLYASEGGPGAWERRQDLGPSGVEPVSARNENRFEAVTTDPVDGAIVMAYGSGGLLYSEDGGSNAATPLALQNIPIGAVELLRKEEFPAPTMLAFAQNEWRGFYAPGDVAVPGQGPLFQNIDVNGVMHSAALAQGKGRFAAATVQGDVYYYFLAESAEPIDISAPDRGIFDLQAVRDGDSDIIYGRTERTLERRVRPPAPQPPEPPGPDEIPPVPPRPPVKLPANIKLDEPELRPDFQEVVLEPGETRELEYQLLLPGTRKIDIAFLVDTTTTMRDHINGLVASMERIIKELAKEGIQGHFGVAEFRHYDSVPYNRFCDIQPPGPDLEDCFDRLPASGGSHKETQLAAMYQAATGHGQNGPGSAFIYPNQEMNFRPDALPVVVIGTDEEFTKGPPHPTFDDTAAALNRVRARQIGLAYEVTDERFPNASPPPGPDLRRMAIMTEAFAAEEVHCDDDGQPDIPVNGPLVCEIPPSQNDLASNIGEAIVATVKALTDFRRVELEVGGDTAAVLDVLPEVYPAIDFKLRQGLFFNVIARCPPVGESQHDVDLVATARDVPIASAGLRVICRSAPVAADDAPPTVVVAVPPPPRPPQLHGPAQPIQNPVTQAQAQTQAQSQAQAQAGLVTQRQSQPQVAAVKVMKPSANLARAGGEGGDDLSFTRYESKKHGGFPPYLGSYVVAAAMGTAFGLLVRVRVRRNYVVSRARRRRTL